MKRKIFWAMSIIAIVSIVLTTACISFLTYREFRLNMEKEVQNQGVFALAGLEAEGKAYLDSLEIKDQSNRITLISSDGTVVYDNMADVTELENHKERKEVKSAMAQGEGESTRLSSTMGEETYYYAILLSDGSVLRLANTIDSVFSTFFSMVPWMILLILVVFVLALVLSKHQVRWILEPLNHLDLEHPTENDVYEELSPLLLRIHHQKDEIKAQMIDARRKQKEFIAITENMSEGLIVLSADSHILSVNQSAKYLLDVTEEDFEGKHILEMNRNLTLQKVAELALKGHSTEETIGQGERSCIIHGNPVVQGGKVRGAILLVVDITERQKTEKLRKEFSANVSHELKTPLTAISGYAELIENDMVKAEDIKDFSHRIHEEALHLLDLIDDIMALSRLDEKNITYVWEKVDVKEMVEDVTMRLNHLAKSKNITITTKGDSLTIEAVPRLMDELIYNLVDNAIKYSDSNGTVEVCLENTGSMAILSVEDQGMGIPQEYQDRVFERFFRVDKSHAKSTGGTGLGLAIVKHVVTYHHGTIHLKSTEKQGTKITISFPL